MIRTPHLLEASNNPRRMKENLVGLLDVEAINVIEAAICLNSAQLYKLGLLHHQFAKRQRPKDWRQFFSRSYYGGYNCARAVKLVHDGHYAQHSGDHQRINNLPSDFPDPMRHGNFLKTLREDRNICDYDHTAKLTDLVLSIAEVQAAMASFFEDTKIYLAARGVAL